MKTTKAINLFKDFQRLTKHGYVAVTLLLLTGCASSVATYDRQPAASAAQANSSDQQRRSTLLHYYRGWKGVPYKYGGNSKRGVDCSGFVHLALKGALAIDAPRSTELLYKIRNRVPKSKLRAGDVVLFRTAARSRHAGIYIGDGQFIHSSKSRGVILSELNNLYWVKTYAKAVRLR